MIKVLALRNRETQFLAVLSLTCLFIAVFRSIYSDSIMFLFLLWNLFLAFVPWLFTSIYKTYPGGKWKKIKVVFLLLSWLLFFPNAPYILTDLFHLKLNSNMPIWFDLVLIMAFAWTGLLFGYLSLFEIERILLSKFNEVYVQLTSLTLLFLSSFGIYVGRYLRWNSWDIVSQPSELMNDITDRVLNPLNHPNTWGMTFFMWVLLVMFYYSFRFFQIKKSDLNF